MKFKFTSLVILFTTIFLFSSCTDELDFNQEFQLEPIVELPLAFSELNQNDFFDEVNLVEIISITDVVDFTLFESSTARNNLTRIDVLLEASNEFDRVFIISVDFLDVNDNITHSLTDIVIRSGDRAFSSTQQIPIRTNQIFLNSRKIRYTINLLPTTSTLDPNIPRVFEFKSAGTFYFNI